MGICICSWESLHAVRATITSGSGFIVQWFNFFFYTLPTLESKRESVLKGRLSIRRGVKVD